MFNKIKLINHSKSSNKRLVYTISVYFLTLMNFTQCDVKNQWNSIESKFNGINGKVFLISYIYQDSIAECLTFNWFTLKPYLIISFCGHHAFLFSTISDTSTPNSSDVWRWNIINYCKCIIIYTLTSIGIWLVYIRASIILK